MDRVIEINENDYDKKVRTSAYVYNFFLFCLYTLVFTLVRAFRLISGSTYSYIVGGGFVIYLLKTMMDIYYNRREQQFRDKLYGQSQDELRRRIRQIIPEDLFRCPADCQLKK